MISRAIKITLAGMGIAAISTVSFAGVVIPYPVEIDYEYRVASGDMVTARYSNSTEESIGCGVRKFLDVVGDIYETGFCQAKDRDENYIICRTTEPELLSAIQSANDFSYITFGWDTEETCNYIGFSSNSFYLPRGLKTNESTETGSSTATTLEN